MQIKELKSEEGTAYATATTHCKRHEQRRQKVQQTLEDCVALNKEFLGLMSEFVEHPNHAGTMVPKCFLYLGGQKDKAKTEFAGRLLWLFVKNQKNSLAMEGECPYLQPNAQQSYLRSLVAIMKEEYDWDYSLEKDFNNTGGLKAKIVTLYAERRKEWPGVYGTGNKQQIPQNADSVTDVDLTVFDENILPDHQKKCQASCGLFLAFRGLKEHAYVLVSQVIEGIFEKGHALEGKPWIGFDNMSDKSHQLSMTNTMMRKTNNLMRIPVEIDNINSPGGMLKRYLMKVSPDQIRLYCREASPGMKRAFRANDYPAAQMSHKQPHGENAIGKMIKEAGKRMGLNTTGHGFPRLSITSVANHPGVNTEESLAHARHSSVTAQRPYLARNAVSEAARFDALGLIGQKKTKKGVEE